MSCDCVVEFLIEDLCHITCKQSIVVEATLETLPMLFFSPYTLLGEYITALT